jgi:serine/threonine protein kinase
MGLTPSLLSDDRTDVVEPAAAATRGPGSAAASTGAALGSAAPPGAASERPVSGSAPDSDDPQPFSERPEIPGYRVVDGLGHGGMAEVWRAERVAAAGVVVPCAVKMLLGSRGTDRSHIERFLDEARIVARLRHPNIVSLLDVGEVGGRIWLAMEWVDGLDLAGLIRLSKKRGTGLPLREALHVLQQVLQGLHHAHTATDDAGEPLHVIHRDISPGNVLISRQGAVKLTDFGVARGTVAQRVERRGTLAGKVHYFAPELFEIGSGATVRTDLFALGVTFWECLSQRPLFGRALSVSELRKDIRDFRPDRLLERDLTLPDGLEPILLRALSPDPAARYASALEFLEDVSDFAYEQGLRTLDAHFAAWVGRLLDATAEAGGRRLIGAPPDGETEAP